MSKKSKFLYRMHELRSQYGSLGRRRKKLKAMGLDDPSKDSRYKELGEFFRMQKDVARHNEWRGVYEEAFRLEHKKAIEEQHKTPHQAKRYARTKAEYAVVKEFSKKVTTTRAVRNAMKPFGEVDIE